MAGSEDDGYQDEETAAYYSLGKKVFSESIDTIKNFIQLMIPLTTGLITAYFALLEFLGVETALKAGNMGSWPVTEPPIILIASLGAFIIASFPTPTQMAIGDLLSIKEYRRNALIWKYSSTLAGSVLFLIAMGKMVYVVMELVGK